jgi:sulfate transport system permease protein
MNPQESPAPPPRLDPLTEPRAVRITLIAIAMVFLTLFLLVPLVLVFAKAFEKGARRTCAAVTEPVALPGDPAHADGRRDRRPVNLLFGIAARGRSRSSSSAGKNLLLTLIDVPFSVSPVISGNALRPAVRRAGLLRPWLFEHDVKIIFALPGIVLSTMFVTSPSSRAS